MRVYKAMIIGFKKSKNKIGHYHPIFKYEDICGNERTYVRQKSMEITPFTIDKNYLICKKGFKTCESSEKKMAPRVYFLILRLFLLAIALINHKVAIWTMIINSAVRLIYKVAMVLSKYNLKMKKDIMCRVDGEIIGYKKVCRVKIFNRGYYKYRPLIKYEYNGRDYVHIGTIGCDEEQKAVGSLCKIYVNTERKLVIDEFEINTPLINIPRLSADAITQTCERIARRTRAAAIKNAAKQAKHNQAELGLSPLRTANPGKVSGWY
jgi:hypothetical protein